MTTATAPVTRMVRSLPAAVHLRALRHTGLTDRDITARAFINAEQLHRALRAGPIGWDVEHRIRSLRIPDTAGLHALTRSTGTRRRLRALHALGWPLPALAAALDWPAYKVVDLYTQHPEPVVEQLPVIDHLAVCALYDQRWAWTPETHGIPVHDAEQARHDAQYTKCFTPLAWDDDKIDDPRAQPRTGAQDHQGHFGSPDHAAAQRALDGDKVRMSGRTRTLAIRYGTRHLDMPLDVIAERLGMTHGSACRAWERIKEQERTASGQQPCWVDEPRFTDRALYLGLARSA
ncbi:hypothetical protein [Streptomyces sp. YIM S03343]